MWQKYTSYSTDISGYSMLKIGVIIARNPFAVNAKRKVEKMNYSKLWASEKEWVLYEWRDTVFSQNELHWTTAKWNKVIS